MRLVLRGIWILLGLLTKFSQQDEWCCENKSKFSLCLPLSGNSTGQMGTTSASPTQTVATAVSFSRARKALSVSDGLYFLVWLHERQRTLVTGHVNNISSLFVFQVSLLTLKLSSCTGSARVTAPSAAVNWTALDWRCWRGLRASWPRLLLWPSWVSLKKNKAHFSQ